MANVSCAYLKSLELSARAAFTYFAFAWLNLALREFRTTPIVASAFIRCVERFDTHLSRIGAACRKCPAASLGETVAVTNQRFHAHFSALRTLIGCFDAHMTDARPSGRSTDSLVARRTNGAEQPTGL